MAGTRSIAFVAHQVTLDHVPAEARVLPLEPTVSVDNKRRIANRPEDFLRPEDDAHVEKATERWAADWWRGTDPDAFNWNGVNRSEERRVGKEWRSGWVRYHEDEEQMDGEVSRGR